MTEIKMFREQLYFARNTLCWLLGISIPKKCANIDSLFFVIYHQMTNHTLCGDRENENSKRELL